MICNAQAKKKALRHSPCPFPHGFALTFDVRSRLVLYCCASPLQAHTLLFYFQSFCRPFASHRSLTDQKTLTSSEIPIAGSPGYSRTLTHSFFYKTFLAGHSSIAQLAPVHIAPEIFHFSSTHTPSTTSHKGPRSVRRHLPNITRGQQTHCVALSLLKT